MNKNPILVQASSPRAAEVKGFALELLEMDSRIQVYNFFGDLEEDFGYLPKKTGLFFPVGVPSAEHDIAHMVEMSNKKRWTIADWGMPSPKNNNGYSEWKSFGGFFAALSREIRVRAIQLHLIPEYGQRETLMNIFANPFWFEMVNKHLPFGRFNSYEDVISWMIDLRDKTRFAWSPERIRHEWIIRLDHIRNWMES